MTNSITSIDASIDPRLQTATSGTPFDTDTSADGRQQAATNPQLQAVRQAIVAKIGASPDGAALLAEVDASANALPKDFSNLSFDQLLAIVMQGANTHAVADANSIGDELNDINETLGELTNLSGQLSTISSGMSADGSTQIPEAVLDELRQLGVSVPDVPPDATGQVTLDKTQVDALVQNTNNEMQVSDGNKTELLQKLTQANNIVNELYDLFSKLTSGLADTDSFINQHAD